MMDELSSKFLRQAKSISLRPEERETGRDALQKMLIETSAEKDPPESLSGSSEFDAFLRVLRRDSSSITLDPSEKEDVRRFLHQHIRSADAIEPSSFPARITERLQAALLTFRWNVQLPAMAIVLALVVTSAGGTVSYAAEGALPGDTLYGVKLYVNEPVFGAIATTFAGKSLWGVRRIERRLEELEALQKRNETVAAQTEPFLQQQINAEVDLLERRLSTAESTPTMRSIRERLDSALVQREALFAAADQSDLTVEERVKVEEQAAEQAQVVRDLRKTLHDQAAAVKEEQQSAEQLERAVQERALMRRARSGVRTASEEEGSIRGLMLRKIRSDAQQERLE